MVKTFRCDATVPAPLRVLRVPLRTQKAVDPRVREIVINGTTFRQLLESSFETRNLSNGQLSNFSITYGFRTPSTKYPSALSTGITGGSRRSCFWTGTQRYRRPPREVNCGNLGPNENGWAISGVFALSIVSALVPWVNGEVILLSLTALAHNHWARICSFYRQVESDGGKCVLYWAGKGVIPLKSNRVKETVSAWKGRFEQSPSKLLSLVFVSSAVGIPPFYVITLLAGVFRVRFGPFFAVGACGRLVRFAVLAFVPWIMLQWFR